MATSAHLVRLTASVLAGALLLATAGCGGDRFGRDATEGRSAPGGGPVFQDYGVNPHLDTAEDNVSTFALDVDTGSYTVTRASLAAGSLPRPASVRTEEFINYFHHDYPAPPDGIGIYLDGTAVPFSDDPLARVVRVGLQAATVEQEQRQPANLTFVIDTSGSMAGHNMEMVKAGLARLLDSLRPDDAVAIVTFSTEAALRLPMTPMTQQERIRGVVADLAPQDMTNLEGGLRLGYEHAQQHLRPDGINRVILLSDGEANVGEIDPHRLAAQIAREAGRHTQLAVIGVGRQTYNEVILEQFANNGNGFYAYIDTVREAERLFGHDLTGTLQAVALDAKVQVSFDPQTVARFRLLGYENRQLEHDQLRDDTVTGGQVGAGHTVTALYEVQLTERAAASRDQHLATVVLRWTEPEDGAAVERSATLTATDLTGSFELAPPRLRQDILVAAFAEVLRAADWAELLTLAQLSEQIGALSRELAHDERLAELAELARTAAKLDR